MIVEEQGVRILTDPGAYSTLQNEAKDIDVILITHEHSDHLHVESLQQVLKNNPQAKIITNNGVGKILKEKNIEFEVFTHGKSAEVNGITIEGFGEKHAEIYRTLTSVENTGYLIAEKLFYPGDAFPSVSKKVEVLALPVAGPWMKISEAIDYALALKPKTVFPVHDGMLNQSRLGPVHVLPQKILSAQGIEFTVLEENKETEF